MMRVALGMLLLCTGAAASTEDTARLPAESLYQLDASLENQQGTRHGLDVYRGHPVLITMFYGSCPATCPLIIDSLRAIERELGAATLADLRVMIISIDPERDTVAALGSLAAQRRIDTNRWALVRTDAATVRTIAALLNVQYRQLPGGEFSHSAVITLLTPEGEIAATSSKLGTPDPQFLAHLRR